MRIELTQSGRDIFTAADEREGIERIAAFVTAAARDGRLVLKDDRGRLIGAEPTEDDLRNQGARQVARDDLDDDEGDGVDDTGRDRSLRIGGASPNERAGGTDSLAP
jgi:hypothetical protein